MLRRVFLSTILLLSLGCVKVNEDKNNGNSANPTAPDPVVPVEPKLNTIDFRVTGTLPSALITYASSIEGTGTVKSDLPWFSSFKTRENTVFLSVKAVYDGFEPGTMTVSIFVNNQLFRTSTATGDGFSPVSTQVSGTFQLFDKEGRLNVKLPDQIPQPTK